MKQTLLELPSLRPSCISPSLPLPPPRGGYRRCPRRIAGCGSSIQVQGREGNAVFSARPSSGCDPPWAAAPQAPPPAPASPAPPLHRPLPFCKHHSYKDSIRCSCLSPAPELQDRTLGPPLASDRHPRERTKQKGNTPLLRSQPSPGTSLRKEGSLQDSGLAAKVLPLITPPVCWLRHR